MNAKWASVFYVFAGLAFCGEVAAYISHLA
jgi:hypothetical protein